MAEAAWVLVEGECRTRRSVTGDSCLADSVNLQSYEVEQAGANLTAEKPLNMQMWEQARRAREGYLFVAPAD